MPKQLIYSLVGQRRVVSAQVGVIFAQSCESAACDQWRIVADRLPKGSTKLAKLMAEAEEKFADGATRKEWVMAMVQASAESINYNVDMEAISELIDSLCDLTKAVNAPEDEVPPKAELSA